MYQHEWENPSEYKGLKQLPSTKCTQKLTTALLESFYLSVWPGSEVIKLFSYSTQLSMKFQLLIKTKIPTKKEVSCFKSLRCCIYHAYKRENANNCWHFYIYEQDKFCAQLSMKKSFITSGPDQSSFAAYQSQIANDPLRTALLIHTQHWPLLFVYSFFSLSHDLLNKISIIMTCCNVQISFQ